LASKKVSLCVRDARDKNREGMSTSTALTEGSIVEKDASTSSLQVHLHPLVIMSVSDHCTRVRVGGGPATQRIVGALLGEQKGRTVDISGRFAVARLGRVAVKQKHAQFRTSFKHTGATDHRRAVLYG
jgi:hypothetical protein